MPALGGKTSSSANARMVPSSKGFEGVIFAQAFGAAPELLEPVMQVNVVTPQEHLGAVSGDLSARRGRIEGMEARGPAQEIEATVPLAKMFGYATQIRSLTRGAATFTMSFDPYEPVPYETAEEIVAARKKRT